MNKITTKIHNKIMFQYKPLAEQLFSEGKTKEQVVSTCNNIIQGKIKDFYKFRNIEPINNLLKDYFELKKHESKAETIFYGMLKENKINFKFQYEIKPYRVDFLVSDNLIIEIDGTQHDKNKDMKRDKYLQEMGYRILRIPIYILSQDPKMIIEEIKKLIEG